VLNVKATAEKAVKDISLDHERSATANSSGRGVEAIKPAIAGKT
jgi:hypothetical protein